MRSILRLASLLTVILLNAPAAAQERTPAEPMSYRGGAWLERVERVEEEMPDRVVELLGLRPGMRVADIGAGTGYYARRFAPLVGSGGKVFAVEIQAEMLEMLEQIAAEEGVEGIESILSVPDDPRLPAEIDVVFFADVYHEVANPTPVIQHVAEALAPGGRVVLLEYRAEDSTGDRIKSDHRMSVRQVVSEWAPHGFQLHDLYEGLPTQHMIVLTLADGSEAPAMDHADLEQAAQAGMVALEASGDKDTAVRLRLTNQTERTLVVTAPAGLVLRTERDDRADMVLTRDLVVRAEPGKRIESEPAAVRWQWNRRTPGGGDQLEIDSSPETLELRPLMAAVQAGMFTPGNQSPRAYAPQTPTVALAALWLTTGGAEFRDVEEDLQSSQMSSRYAAAFGMALAAEAGVDPSAYPAWRVRGEIFGSLQHPPLRDWYRGCC